MKKYEAMFLFDPTSVSEWEAIQAELQRLMERAGARVIVCTKWDERRLAYEIRGRKRGVYVLTYFEADPAKIVGLERDCQLSESILRILVVRADHLSEEQMTQAAEQSAARPEEDAGPPDRRPVPKRTDAPAAVVAGPVVKETQGTDAEKKADTPATGEADVAVAPAPAPSED